ncbi:MAG: NAD(P)H-dependent oxidoreductase subunit E [Clostridia bacterium]|nr:NAD(P)H-dependent oxidoreductase subunit E [Clostridia bacterium]
MIGSEIREMIEYYRRQGAPQDQQMIIALLREVQEAEGGVLAGYVIEAIAQAYGVKSAMLQAIIRRIPTLCCEDAPHRLEVCGTCKGGAKLRDYIERTYGVKSGGVSREAGFVYRVTPCMKNCKNGPSVRWDGTLYAGADEALILRLVKG